MALPLFILLFIGRILIQGKGNPRFFHALFLLDFNYNTRGMYMHLIVGRR